jgi:hypothetical protein
VHALQAPIFPKARLWHNVWYSMPTIRIREANLPGQAAISFDHGQEFLVQVNEPLTEESRKRFAWYFENYVSRPGALPGEESIVARSLREYGQALFEQIFSNREVYAAFAQLMAGEFEIEVVGSPAFHKILWETLWNPRENAPLAHRAPLIRRNLLPGSEFRSAPAPVLRILLVVARPRGPADVAYQTISLPLIELLKNTGVRAEVDVVRPGTWDALRDKVHEQGLGYYHILHFDGHGEIQLAPGPDNTDIEEARLFFESGGASRHPVRGRDFAELLSSYQIPAVILNACESARETGTSESSLASLLISAGIHTVVAMNYSCTVSAAKSFMSAFYGELFANKTFEQALLAGRQKLWDDKRRLAAGDKPIELEDWLLPVMYQSGPAHLALRPMQADEMEEYYSRLAKWSRLPLIRNRDREVIEIERRLLADTNSNVLYIEAEPRSGMTALLHHLAALWQATGFCKHLFLFSQDDRNRQDLMERIARVVLPEADLGAFVKRLSESARTERLRQALAMERHLVIIDGAEADNTAALCDFVQRLAGGKSIVLLAGGQKPGWVAGEPYRLSPLPGMQPGPPHRARVDVFLAESNAALEGGCIQPLISELEQHGFPVFHEYLGRTAAEVETKARGALRYCKLAVFVAGPSASRGPEGTGLSVLELQYHAAMELKIPCLVWLTAAKATDPRQEALYAEFKSNANRDLLDESKNVEQVRERLMAILRKPQAPEIPMPPPEPVEEWPVYLLFEPNEPKFSGQPPPVPALEFRDEMLRTRRFRVEYPLLDANATRKQRRQTHETSLTGARSVVLYWNLASEYWVKEQITEIRKKTGGKAERNAVLITGALSDAKRGFNDLNFRPFSDAQQLIRYLAEGHE